jgi:membrane protein
MSTMELSWTRTLPGAVLATVLWFVTTLIFGWYVTRFANYSEVYGSLGAGIALLFWLYIISLSVLCGAEFNAQLYAAALHQPVVKTPPPVAEMPAPMAETPAPESVHREG